MHVVHEAPDEEYPAAARLEQILGCQRSTPVPTPEGLPVRALTIVRFAESLPSRVTFEIDAHELCHAVAALQLLRFDPCHEGNGGVVQADERIGSSLIR